MGCIHDVKQSELIVSLPGIGNYGYVKLNNISTIYTTALKKCAENSDAQPFALNECYSKGNLVRCKVLSYTNNKLLLTIEPTQVNSSLSYQSLENGMVR